MKIKSTILLLMIFWASYSFAQQISNIHFEQVAKQIHIYYNLEGNQEYTVQVFCSTDNGQSWGRPLKHVTGAVGENQKPGKGKMIVWDVLAERDKLSGNIQFRLEAFPGNIGFFTDIRDGQTYKCVQIGKQIWMAENLNYKTANSWCYNNKAANCNQYGRLYRLNAARTVCPAGWHLPTDDEWKELEMFLGINQYEANTTGWRGTNEGKKLKRTSGWNSNGKGTNKVDFMAIPGGYRYTNGNFLNLGFNGFWWSATPNDFSNAWYRYLYSDNDKVYRNYYNKMYGLSVRCVRD